MIVFAATREMYSFLIFLVIDNIVFYTVFEYYL